MSNEQGDSVRTIIELIEGRIPRDLADGERIRRATFPILEAAMRLRAVRLSNADEPMPIFHPFRGPD
jgi:hypothetical protein